MFITECHLPPCIPTGTNPQRRSFFLLQSATIQDLPDAAAVVLLSKCDLTSRLNLSSESRTYFYALKDPGLWRDVTFTEHIVPKRLLSLLEQNAQNVKTITCSSRRDEEITENHFNQVLKKLVNLEVVNLNNCRCVYDLRFLNNTNKVKCLRLSHALYFDPLYFTDSIKTLTNLEEFEMTDISLMSGYEVLTALSNKPHLRVVNIVNSGPIRAEWAVSFLRSVPNLKVFLFTSYYHHDSVPDRIRWYKILRQHYKHITYTDNFIKKVEKYEVEDSYVALLKYLDGQAK